MEPQREIEKLIAMVLQVACKCNMKDNIEQGQENDNQPSRISLIIKVHLSVLSRISNLPDFFQADARLWNKTAKSGVYFVYLSDKSVNMKILNRIKLLSVVLLLSTGSVAWAQNNNAALDEKVKSFLNDHSRGWYDMNVPASDGQLLFDIIVKNNYKSALEIGTSTGHSGIWIAWALSKTGGKLITVDIDEGRHKQALENFKKAGLSEYIDARLADAHVLVKELKGPFDFVFSDADKDWYKNYFTDVDPKLKVGGCFTAHNISSGGRGGNGGQAVFFDYVKSLKNYETTLNSNGGGVSISYKRSEK
jgi:caffeoyl-CoA O-methyltransferase